MPENRASHPAPAETGFAPGDLTDNRERYNWVSRWPPDARKRIRIEAGYLTVLLLAGCVGLWACFQRIVSHPNSWEVVDIAGICLAAGLLGGTAFGLKWFVHVTSKGLWHVDRQYWRYFSPIVSAILAMFVTGALFQRDIAASSPATLGVLSRATITAFIAGYFSDNAFAKLAEVAGVLFGTSVSRNKTIAEHPDERAP